MFFLNRLDIPMARALTLWSLAFIIWEMLTDSPDTRENEGRREHLS